MLTLGHFFILIGLVIVMLSILTVTMIFKNKRLVKKELFIIVPVLIIALLYFFNIHFYYFVRTNIFPNRVCSIERYNGNGSGPTLTSTQYRIKLPSKSVFLFRSPEQVYYSSNNSGQCKEFFNETLSEEKNNNQIIGYSYNSIKKEFIVNINKKDEFKIDFIGDIDDRRYAVSPIGK